MIPRLVALFRRGSGWSICVVVLAIAATCPAVVAAKQATNPGTLDPAFGGDGRVLTQIGPYAEARAVAAQPDGKVLAAGLGGPLQNEFAVARYKSDGTLDESWGFGGIVLTKLTSEGSDYAEAIVVQPDGKVLVAGRAPVDAGAGFVRYNPDGSLDSTFGGDGMVVLGGVPPVFDLALQPDGRILAAGGGFRITRLLPSGDVDNSFGTSGVAQIDFGPDGTRASAVVVQGDGRIVAAGYAGFPFNTDAAIARLNADGSLDPSFGSEGRARLVITESWDEASDVALDGEERILLAGTTGLHQSGVDPDFLIARYTPTGLLDSAFGDGGVVETDAYGHFDSGRSIAITADEDVLVGGVVSQRPATRSYDFGVVRYQTDGAIDPSFGVDGIARVDFATLQDTLGEFVLQPDGRLVMAGGAYMSVGDFGADSRFALARIFAAQPSLELSIFDTSILEGDDGRRSATFRIVANAPAESSVVVSYMTLDGSATASDDYFAKSGTVMLVAGDQDVTITVPLITDLDLEPDETFSVVLLGAPGAVVIDDEALGTIVNDD